MALRPVVWNGIVCLGNEAMTADEAIALGERLIALGEGVNDEIYRNLDAQGADRKENLTTEQGAI